MRDLARRKLLGGGFFSWRWSNSRTGEQVGSISIGVSQDALELTFCANDRPVAQRIELERTGCRFGGSRPWMRCVQCWRRVAVLFYRGGVFACRSCGRIAYASQSEDSLGRGWRRQNKLEARLGENWKRPSGMRHATYHRILEGIFACEDERDIALESYLVSKGLTAW